MTLKYYSQQGASFGVKILYPNTPRFLKHQFIEPPGTVQIHIFWCYKYEGFAFLGWSATFDDQRICATRNAGNICVIRLGPWWLLGHLSRYLLGFCCYLKWWNHIISDHHNPPELGFPTPIVERVTGNRAKKRPRPADMLVWVEMRHPRVKVKRPLNPVSVKKVH